MKDMRQKMILGCLAVVLLIAVIIGVAQCGNTQTGNPNSTGTEDSTVEGGTEEDGDRILTKGEWLQGLASTFGMTEYTTETPFFTDIDSSHELYAMAQSSAEWGIFEKTGIAFEADTEVTREFVVASAVIAAEAIDAQGDAKYPTYEECITYAAEQKVITGTEESYLAESMTSNDAQKILDWALDTYMNPAIEEHEHIVFQDNVVNLMEYTDAVTFQNGTVTIAASITEAVNAGDVLLIPATADEPFGMALKTVEISADAEGNRIITTEQATIDDVYKEFDIAGYAIPTKENLILGEGITLLPDEAPMAEQMSAETEQEDAEEEIQGFHGAFSVNYSSEGKYTVTKEWGDSRVQFGEEIVYKLEEGEKSPEEVMDIYAISNAYFQNGQITPTEDKFEGGYEITGTVAIKNLYFTVEVQKKQEDDVNQTELQKVELQVHCEAESNLTVNGEFKSKFLLTKKPIPVYARAGMGVYAEVFVYVDGNGEISVTLGNELHTKITYENNRLKKTAECADTLDTKCNASMENGGELSLDVRLFNIRLWCVEVRAGEQLDFEASLGLKTTEEDLGEVIIVKNEYTWHSALYATLPEIKLSTGGDNCWIKGGQGSWELIGSDGIIRKIDKETLFSNSIYLGYETKEKKDPDKLEEVIWDSEHGKIRIKYNPEKVNVQLTNPFIIHIRSKEDMYGMDFAFSSNDSTATKVYQVAQAVVKNPIDGMHVISDAEGYMTYIPYEEPHVWGGWDPEPNWADKEYYMYFAIRSKREISNLQKFTTEYDMVVNHYCTIDTWRKYKLDYGFDVDDETGEVDLTYRWDIDAWEDIEAFEADWRVWLKSNFARGEVQEPDKMRVYVINVGNICVSGHVYLNYESLNSDEHTAFADEILNEIIFEYVK